MVLLGAAGVGKTPLAKSLAKVATANWQGLSSESTPFFVVTSQVDSLRTLAREMSPGSAVVLDEWEPSQAAGGRSVHLPTNDVKELLSTQGGTVGTRYGDAALPAGPRLVTANSASLSKWFGLRSDNFQSMSQEERASLGSNKEDDKTGPIHKRCLFVWVKDPVVRASTKRTFDDSRRLEQAKRLKQTLDLLEPGFSFE